ncbi:MAG TPA: bifunctional 4-hydroxy-2-oxoglutarate aldolase/2-dehydro-3-deoxy-phosphogluconate aldolase [Deltaproteobacteria bacterium]|nr:bifunctional 4-hydroxy-2-oxoglutarate aldolase/2-dehydro-3-deoxy-phosphogluconate aldolase [Deltaproteobacteria bacterium]
MNREHEKKWMISPEEILSDRPVIPVMVIEKLEQAVPLARAILKGGIRVLEITLRTPVALDAISEIRKNVPDAVVGAGTVTNSRDLYDVLDAGGLFAISPGLTPDLLNEAIRGPIALIPGISTVSELMLGLERGYEYFKFFPAEAAGGIKMLKSIAGPFPDVKFCPTGGISRTNYRDYLALDNVLCVGGSWVVPTDLVREKNWDAITELIKEAVN